MTELSAVYTEVLHRHLAAETVFDMEGTLATLTEDCLFEDMATGETSRGREGVRSYYHEWWTAFGIIPQDIRSYIVAEPRTRGGGVLGPPPPAAQARPRQSHGARGHLRARWFLAAASASVPGHRLRCKRRYKNCCRRRTRRRHSCR